MIPIIKILFIISGMWKDNASFSLAQTLFIGLFFFVCSEALCLVIHILQREMMFEYGYGQKSMSKKGRKKYKKKRLIDRILLLSLYKKAKRKGLFMIMCFSCNLLGCIAFLTSIVGYVGCILTRGFGWTMVLLLSGIWIFIIIGVIEFFPSFVLRSERERYPWFKRKK